MHQGDFEGFKALMSRVAAVYSKKLSDELVQGFWTALRDQSLTTITELANAHIRYGKFFPKPIELRPKDDKPAATPDGKFEEGERRAIENLEELRQMHPDAWLARMERDRPGCRAIQYAHEFGARNIWYDNAQRCWRKSV